MSIKVVFANKYLSEVIWEENLTNTEFEKHTKRLLAVVDSNAEWFFKQSILSNVKIPYFVFDEPSEIKKNQETVDKIHDFLFEKAADRKSILLAIGGGITLDTVGFAASVYKRGIDWIAVPTTLLAQVDASVGGKTAINHPVYGKNVIGTFHPPIKVFIDSSCSLTWNDELRLEGIAEMYKIFKTFDHSSLNKLIKKPNDSLTKRSIELKAKVVDIDPYEMNLRAILNYGHTFAHALESLVNNDQDHRKLPHGIAVSAGMRLENCVASILGIMTDDELEKAEKELDKLGFPHIKLPEFESLINFMLQDKKAESGKINLCLIDGKKEVNFEPVDPRTHANINLLRDGYEKYLKEFQNAR